MYIIQNAWKSITRNKLRNVLIGIIVLVIAVSACVALSIRQAAETTKEDTLSTMSVTAQITYDRSSAMEEMASSGEAPSEDGEEPSFSRDNFDFDALESSLTLDEYLTYTSALQDGDTYYYSAALSLNSGSDSLLAYGTEESSDSSSTSTDSTSTDAASNMPGGDIGGTISSSDFTVTGYSSYDAMLDMFGTDGTYSISEGSMFDESASDYTCVISDELALYNDLSVGDTITLSNPNYESETYTLTIVGIYTNSASSEGGFSMVDPANEIFVSYGTATAITDASAATGYTYTNDNSEEVSAALTSMFTFTYSFSSVEHYESFATAVYDLGLSEDYTVSSSDLTAFEESLEPLETLSTMALWFFVIVLIVGGVILVTLNIFNLRERKYEVGVLTAIGMKKQKVAAQFLTEIFIVTFAAIIVGAAIGAAASLPITNALLDSQISSSTTTAETLNSNFGFDSGSAPSGGDMPSGDMSSEGGGMVGGGGTSLDNAEGNVSYVDSVSSATNLTVLLQLVGVGVLLTIVSSLAALISIMRYEPLKILSSRS